MRYSKTQVNEIVDQVMGAAHDNFDTDLDDGFAAAVDLIREEHLLVDRRLSSIPEYLNDIVFDFVTLKLSYKELMAKYHCSMRTVRSLLMEESESNEQVAAELKYRRH